MKATISFITKQSRDEMVRRFASLEAVAQIAEGSDREPEELESEIAAMLDDKLSKCINADGTLVLELNLANGVTSFLPPFS